MCDVFLYLQIVYIWATTVHGRMNWTSIVLLFCIFVSSLCALSIHKKKLSASMTFLLILADIAYIYFFLFLEKIYYKIYYYIRKKEYSYTNTNIYNNPYSFFKLRCVSLCCCHKISCIQQSCHKNWSQNYPQCFICKLYSLYQTITCNIWCDKFLIII